VPKKKRLLLAQPTRHQPKTAFSRLPPLHRADLEGRLWVREHALRERRLAGTFATHPARLRHSSELDLLRQSQSIIDLDPKITDRALDLRVSERTRVIMHLL
jgi:hypothetical protein